MKRITSLFKTCACLGTFALAALFTHSTLSAAEKNVASFETDESLKYWTSVNDGVMGGISKGGFKRSEQGTLLFTGNLSLENNGGFASIRMKSSALGLSGMSALVVKARGDGRTYWVDVRVNNQMSAGSYRAYLTTTAGEWQETRIPFADFKLQTLGRELAVKPLNAAAVASVGFTLSDKKAGPFALEVASVKASDGESSAEPVKNGNNLVDVAKAAGGFKTLLAAATAANLVGVLSGEGPLTVLAPTDEAFAKLPSGTVETLLKPENREQLVAILKNHVIAGRVTLTKALEAREAASLQGSKIAFKFEDGRVRVGPATLVKADIAASNGVIHVIDQVLIPAAEPVKSANNLVDVAKAAGGFKTLLAAATAANLVGVLSGEGPLTVLAPTDEAFAKLPKGTVESLLKPENKSQLVEILKNHVIAGRVTLAKALEARQAASLQGSKIAFKLDDGRVRVGPATLVKADIAASNGVIHVIDQVLIPTKTEAKPLNAGELIQLAIELGVPIFNHGDVAGCAAVYEITAEALRTMSTVPEASRKVLVKAINEARLEKSARQRAWILRAALDETFESLN